MGGLSQRWHVFEGIALAAYARLVTRTARWTIEGEEYFQATQGEDRPVLWTTWHGVQYPVLMYGIKAVDTSQFLIITVGDERSEILDAMVHNIGGETVAVDMGGNPMAAGRAVLNVVRHLRAGRQSIIMPDGPDGPAFEAKGGVFFLARKARAVVLPVGTWARPAFVLPRWDRYVVPLPFSRLFVVFGEPILIDNRADAADLKERLPGILTLLRSRARVLAGKRP